MMATQSQDEPKPQLLAINPYYRPSENYSGPSVFFDRLFSKVSNEYAVSVVTVGKTGDDPIPWAATTIRLMKAGRLSRTAQLEWMLKTFHFILFKTPPGTDIHIHGTFWLNMGAAAAAIIRGLRVTLLPLAEGSDLRGPHRGLAGKLSMLAKQQFVRRAHVGLALSDGIATEFGQLGLPPTKTYRIANVVAEEYFAAIDPQLESETLVFVGQIGSRKRAGLVLDCVHELRSSGRKVEAVFIGPFTSIAEEREFRGMVEDMHLTMAVHIPGMQSSPHDVVRLIKEYKGSIFFLPSSKEGLPGAMAEAMALGLPVVVTDVGAMGDIVRTSKAGRVVSPNVESARDALIELWNNRAEWERCSQSARVFARRHFTPTAVCSKYITAVQHRQTGSTG